MASSSAVQSKTHLFHFPFQAKLNAQKKQPAAQDTFEATKSRTLDRPSGAGRPQALIQGDEKARKGGLLDCFGLLAILALCCACCESSGNTGYGRRRYLRNNPKRNLNNNPPPAPKSNAVRAPLV